MADSYARALHQLADDLDKIISRAKDNGLTADEIAAELKSAAEGLEAEA